MRLYGQLYGMEPLEGLSALAHLNAGHEIYRAHFPGSPITPGVCIIQMAVEIFEELSGRKLQITEIRDAKFLSPVVPGISGSLLFEYDSSRADDSALRLNVAVSCSDSGTRAAKITLLCIASD